MDMVEKVTSTLAAVVNGVHHNHYSLTIDGFNQSTELSVLSLDGQESLNQPWCPVFSSHDKPHQ